MDKLYFMKVKKFYSREDTVKETKATDLEEILIIYQMSHLHPEYIKKLQDSLIVGKKLWSDTSLKKTYDGKYTGRNTEHQVIRGVQI